MRARAEAWLEGWYERLTLLRAVRTIIVLAAALVAVAGALARLVEPDTFKSIGLAYWWAAETVTTVGYGDTVPHGAAGRVVGVLLMLTGLSLIPTLTSVIVSILLSKRARAEHDEVARERQDVASALARIEERLARMEERPG